MRLKQKVLTWRHLEADFLSALIIRNDKKMHGYKNLVSKKTMFFCMLLNEDELYIKKYRAQHDLKLSPVDRLPV
jgi:hypothetical protein